MGQALGKMKCMNYHSALRWPLERLEPKPRLGSCDSLSRLAVARRKFCSRAKAIEREGFDPGIRLVRLATKSELERMPASMRSLGTPTEGT